MYKVFINKGILTIGGEPISVAGDEKVLNLLCEEGDPLKGFIEEILHHHDSRHVHLFSSDFTVLISRFESHFECLDAAGGIVRDSAGNVLMIFRRGQWDFPKGKLEEGEGEQQGEIREVEEETGVQVSALLPQRTETRHYYAEGEKRILKRTVWFLMQTSEERPVVRPQIEEDIESCVWLGPAEAIQKIKEGGYASLADLIPLIQS
jgi:8-oxo-dGTP pyrophosphatase MutT (NUDIX family)